MKQKEDIKKAERNIYTEFEFFKSKWTNVFYWAVYTCVIFFFLSFILIIIDSIVTALWSMAAFISVGFLLHKIQQLRREWFYFHYDNKIQKKHAQAQEKLKQEIKTQPKQELVTQPAPETEPAKDRPRQKMEFKTTEFYKH